MVTHEKSVGAVIYKKRDGEVKFLLLHYQSGHWDFPKGHPEEGETEEEALRREVREETGIMQLEIMPGFSEATGFYYEARGNEMKRRIKEGRGVKIEKEVIYYLAETKEEEIKISHEHVGFVWLNYEESLRRITYENSREVLRKLSRHIK